MQTVDRPDKGAYNRGDFGEARIDIMKKTVVCRMLGIDYPILQGAIPWISGHQLVAAVSVAGGLGILHPSAGMGPKDDPVTNLRENMRQVRRITANPFGVALYLGHPQIQELIDVAVKEGARIAVTYGGSPGLYTGYLKEREVKVLHQVALVRHARSAASQGVDVVIAAGFEGGGPRGTNEISTMVLVPQVVDAVPIPVIASGGIVDPRGFGAALALGAQGIEMGTRFIATTECIAHQNYKEALLAAIDSGTVVAGRYQYPTRLLRTDIGLKERVQPAPKKGDKMAVWEPHLGLHAVRASLMDGDLMAGPAYAGAGVGLISEILDAGDIIRNFVEQVDRSLMAPR